MTRGDGAVSDSVPPEVVPPLPDGVGAGAPVTILWRPGCPFCALLLRGLERTGLNFDRVDIWDEPAAAAWVRVVADGNETVPTVRIAGEDPDRAVALVNPSVSAVLEAVGRVAPVALPTARPASVPVRLLARLSGRLGGRLSGRVRGRRGPGRTPAGPR